MVASGSSEERPAWSWVKNWLPTPMMNHAFVGGKILLKGEHFRNSSVLHQRQLSSSHYCSSVMIPGRPSSCEAQHCPQHSHSFLKVRKKGWCQQHQQRKIRRDTRKSFLLIGVVKHGHGSPERLQHLHAWNHSNLRWTWHWATSSKPDHNSVIVCISKIQRFGRENFLELMTATYPPACQGQSCKAQRFFHGSGLAPDLPLVTDTLIFTLCFVFC